MNPKVLIGGMLAVVVTVLVAVIFLRERAATVVVEGDATASVIKRSPIASPTPRVDSTRVNGAVERTPRDGSGDIPPTPTQLPLNNVDLPTTFGTTVLPEDATTTSVLGIEYLITDEGLLVELTAAQREELRRRNVESSAASGAGAIDPQTGQPLDPNATPTDDADDQPDLPAGEQIIGGRVLRGTRGVAKALVQLTYSENGGQRTFETGGDGSFAFQSLAPGSYRLYLYKPSAPNNSRNVTVTEGEDRLREDFLIPDYPPVNGRVVDAENNGVEATLEVLQGPTIRGSLPTDAEGYFALFPLDPGTYLVRARATGYLPAEASATVPESGVPADLLLVLGAAARIDGQVIGPTGGVGGAWVALFSTGAFGDPLTAFGVETTTAAGRYGFSVPGELPTTTFRAGAFKEGFVPGYSSGVAVGSDTKNIVVTLSAGGEITGTIVGSDEAPLEGIEVAISTGFSTTAAIFQRFNAPFPRAVTNELGRFRLTGIEPGAVVFSIAALGYASQAIPLTVRNGANDAGRIVMLTTDEAAKEGRIFGSVTDEVGRGLVAHGIYLRHNDGSSHNARTDNRGGFVLDQLPAGGYTLFTNGSMLRGDLFVTMDQTVPGLEAGGGAVYVVYDFGQSARVRVVDGGGAPVPSVRVRCTVRRQGSGATGAYPEKVEATWEHTIPTEDGRLKLEALLAGSATFTFSVEGVGTAELAGKTIRPGQSLDLGEVRVGTGLEMQGRVTNSNGAPLSGALVEAIVPQTDQRMSTTTDSNGAWKLTALPNRPLNLTFSREGFVQEIRANVAPDGGGPGEVALRDGGKLSGRILNPEGMPIDRVEIRVLSGQGIVKLYSNGEGRFASSSLAVGGCQLQFTDPSGVYELDPVQAEVRAEGQEPIDFRMRRR